MKKFLILAAALTIGTPVAAAPTAIINATVHTIAGAVISNGTVIFDNGTVTAVGEGLAPPVGATVIDAQGKPVTPGLISSFSQVGILDIELVKGTNDTEANTDLFSAAFDVAPGINPNSNMLAITRKGGVTHVIAAPDYSKSIFAGQGALLSLGDGAAFGVKPKIAMFMTLSETSKRLGGGSRGAVWTFLKQAFEDARYYERNRKDFDSNKARTTVLPTMDLEALLPVLNGKMPLVVDVHRAADIQAVIKMADEYKLDVILIGVREGWKVADEIARAGIPVILDPTNNLPTRFDSLGATLENAAKLNAADVKVAFAVMGDQLSYNARNLSFYAGLAAANGMPQDAALAAVTKNPAEIWGIANRHGSLEPGKQADVVIWDGDPLEVTSAPTSVFIKGEAQNLVTRQDMLRERYRNVGVPNQLGYR